jgi:hypothetical protein
MDFIVKVNVGSKVGLMLGSTASWLTFAPLFFQKRSGLAPSVMY